jgi:oxygen-independent coproporphyrinogen III oxidase
MRMIGNCSSSDISLYFHIPFCTRKCDYCHFYVLPDKETSKDQLLEGFKLEWERWQPALKGKRIVTLYFGGGTPFLFGPSRLYSVLEMVRKQACVASDAEITLEANPENVSFSVMKDYQEAGINRVSLGVQTLDQELLQLLGRLHTADKALEAIQTAYKAGLSNISIDLMYDLPKQTLQHWEKTLAAIQDLPISHLSLYNLTIEPHTLFFKRQEILRKHLPDEETSLAMYEKAIEMLEKMELKQYEISAFAKKETFSRHNVGYWTARSFLGFGPSAFSYWEGKRFHNIANQNRYCTALKQGASPIDFEELLDPYAHARELLVIQLRLRAGVDLSLFQQAHGQLQPETEHVLRSLERDDFIQQSGTHLSLTKKGILFYDTVAAELI